ncbi:S9 family peptidase, partial [Streptomyces sp. UNOC14_S4]|uniref:alpha/beta hydrolase family protein n=1 Tax=Streptomyces sp. UNOC14_S4 TaxID=2872340 RepID=UPI001E38C408
MRLRTPVFLATALCAVAATASPAPSLAHAETRREPVHVEGRLPSDATYVMDLPAGWNGTVLLFSHGYRPTGAPNPAADAPGEDTRTRLLDEGYALIGSSYASTGWAITDAVPDQLATLDLFTRRFGPARRTIAWGQSFGGLVTTALAERHPDRFDGSLSLCGLVQGGVANWNNTLDPVFALRTLLAPDSGIRLTGFRDQADARTAADALTAEVSRAQRTPAGRARIALAAALHNIPTWNDTAQTEPGPHDRDAQQANQYQAVVGLLRIAAFTRRQEAESRAGGNPSWNTGVDYATLLDRSSVREEVTELYHEAGLSLRDDLAALDRAPRIGADPRAVAWTARTSSLTGRLSRPQLNVHTTGDALIPVQAESAHHRAATAAGSTALLRQAYVRAPGHCTFSLGETLAAVHTLENHITTGHWATTPDTLNSLAVQEDASAPARYADYRPAPYLRPYD